MPRTKKITVRKGKQEVQNIPSTSAGPKKSSSKVRNIVFILILVLALLFWKFKGYFIAATVNGQPISRWELTNLLIRRFGQQSLDTVINERLILGAARQKGIFITPIDIEQKVNETKKQLEGKMTLDEALKYQGATIEEFKRNIEIQLSIDKLFDKEASVSNSEINDYLTKNSQLSKGSTDPASLQAQVREILRQQKVTDLFDTWFTDIRKNAKIQKFL